MTQTNLFGLPPRESAPYVPHSATSKAAAESIAEDAGTLRAKVLAYLRAQPFGATDEQMQRDLQMNPSTQRPRRGELVARGLVGNAGCKRPTASGRAATVWESTR